MRTNHKTSKDTVKTSRSWSAKFHFFKLFKILMLFYFIVFGYYVSGQNPKIQDINSCLNSDSFIGILKLDDRIVDKYIPPPRRKTNINNRDVTIDVNFNGGWTTQAQDAFLFAVQIWEDLLTSPVTIEVDAEFATLPGGVIGRSFRPDLFRNFTSTDPEFLTDTWYVAALANKLSGTDQNGGSEEIELEFSNTFPFYFGTDGNCPATEIDFVTVVLHELGHGLGLTPSTVQQLGGDLIYGENGDPISYDRFVIDGTGTRLTDFATGTPSIPLDNFLQSNDLFWDSGSEANGSRLFAPVNWEPGSSISHLDEVTFNPTNSSLMTPFLAWGEAIHNPGPIALAMLDDIGWDIDEVNEPVLDVNLDVNYTGCEDFAESITVNVTGGVLPYAFQWSNGATTQTILNIPPGEYSVTVSDALNNFEVETITIEPRIYVSSDDFLWSDIVDDYDLSADQLINRNIYIEDNLLINMDYTFSGVTFNFAESAKLQTPKNIIINEFEGKKSILKTCDGEEWEGILVFDWGKLDMDNTEIYNARIGINGQDEATLDLGGWFDGGPVLINGNNGDIGVYLDGNVSCTTMWLTIENYETGVKSENNTKMPRFSFTTINNSNIGFDFNSSPTVVGFSITDSRETSIKLDNCHGSILGFNGFRSGDYGINAFNSSSLNIQYISAADYNLNTGINLNNCPYSKISNSIGITAKEYGIKAFASNGLTIENNNINVAGIPYLDGGAVKLTECNDSKIKNNTIDASQCTFGIENNNSFNNEIKNNENITVFSSISIRTAGIRNVGSVLNNISENTIDGVAHTAGILDQNAPGNFFDCNIVTTTGTGLGVYTNSMYQSIRGNTFNDSDTSLTIRSVIGPQYYHGNKFVSGKAVAIGLDDDEIEKSRFFVNPNIPNHMPNYVEPSNWFIPDVTQDSFYRCDYDGGSRRESGFDDKKALNSYFDNVKQLENSDPESFFVKMIHLLNYDYARDDFTLPDYIRQDPIWGEHSEITQLAALIDETNRVKQLSEKSMLTEEYISMLDRLQDVYVNARDSEERKKAYNELRELLVKLQPAFEYEYTQDSIAYEELKDKFAKLSGSDISKQWADIYKYYIDFVQTGVVAKENKAVLEEYSQQCSDRYGDAIHLARAMVNTYNSTYYDVYDGCLDNPLKPRVAKASPFNATIQPNPTTGEFTLYFDNKISGKLLIFDISGQQIYKRDISNSNKIKLGLNLKEGVYFINIHTDTGDEYADKLFIVK